MSIIGISFYFAFGGNLLVQWGLMPGNDVKGRGSAWHALVFVSASALASLVIGLVYRYALTPWGLESMAPVVFALLLFGAFASLQLVRTLAPSLHEALADKNSFQVTLVLYAAAMATGERFSSPWHLLGGGAAAVLGYLAAVCFLGAIIERLELEPVPESFKGEPIRFLSAGLIALAFSGVDTSLLTGFFG
ncbi:MAG: hypothetical protein JXM71_09190 [Spirochaetales bacterium]|nr:hypothetical protein [Spirochaetales bacterium]